MDSSGIVSKEELEIIDTLGEGEFGFVYRGSLRHLNGNLVSFFISFTGRMSLIGFINCTLTDTCRHKNITRRSNGIQPGRVPQGGSCHDETGTSVYRPADSTLQRPTTYDGNISQ